MPLIQTFRQLRRKASTCILKLMVLRLPSSQTRIYLCSTYDETLTLMPWSHRRRVRPVGPGGGEICKLTHLISIKSTDCVVDAGWRWSVGGTACSPRPLWSIHGLQAGPVGGDRRQNLELVGSGRSDLSSTVVLDLPDRTVRLWSTWGSRRGPRQESLLSVTNIGQIELISDLFGGVGELFTGVLDWVESIADCSRNGPRNRSEHGPGISWRPPQPIPWPFRPVSWTDFDLLWSRAVHGIHLDPTQVWVHAHYFDFCPRGWPDQPRISPRAIPSWKNCVTHLHIISIFAYINPD